MLISSSRICIRPISAFLIQEKRQKIQNLILLSVCVVIVTQHSDKLYFVFLNKDYIIHSVDLLSYNQLLMIAIVICQCNIKIQ